MRYRQYAANCLKMARGIADPATKSSLIDMAQVWVNLAEQTEKDERPSAPFPTNAFGHIASPRKFGQ
jgi:hypothetical protein